MATAAWYGASYSVSSFHGLPRPAKDPMSSWSTVLWVTGVSGSLIDLVGSEDGAIAVVVLAFSGDQVFSLWGLSVWVSAAV